jgi:hypothetical protein
MSGSCRSLRLGYFRITPLIARVSLGSASQREAGRPEFEPLYDRLGAIFLEVPP